MEGEIAGQKESRATLNNQNTMSIQTSIMFLNSNDPEYQAALKGTPEERYEWESEWGSFEDRPGKPLDVDSDSLRETEDEYGGWIVDLSKLPEGTTHIVIFRS